MQGTMPGARSKEGHARPGWTTSRREQDSPWKSIRMAEDRDKLRKYAMVWPTLGSRTAKEQNRLGLLRMHSK